MQGPTAESTTRADYALVLALSSIIFLPISGPLAFLPVSSFIDSIWTAGWLQLPGF